jgi:hypothetical protein
VAHFLQVSPAKPRSVHLTHLDLITLTTESKSGAQWLQAVLFQVVTRVGSLPGPPSLNDGTINRLRKRASSCTPDDVNNPKEVSLKVVTSPFPIVVLVPRSFTRLNVEDDGHFIHRNTFSFHLSLTFQATRKQFRYPEHLSLRNYVPSWWLVTAGHKDDLT